MSFIKAGTNDDDSNQCHITNNRKLTGAQAHEQPVNEEGTLSTENDLSKINQCPHGDPDFILTTITPTSVIMINNSSVDNAATNGARTIEAIACVCLEDDYYSATSGADMTDPIATIPIPTEDQTATTATGNIYAAVSSNSENRAAAVVSEDNTARPILKEDEKEISAQPSSFSTPLMSSTASHPFLCRTFRQTQQSSIAQSQTVCSTTPPSPSVSSVSSTSTFVEGSLDEVLLTALQNRQDRFFLLKLEREYCNFIEDPSKDVLEYPFLNSYFRMMIHRSAIYYQLARSVDVVQRKIRLTKTEHSAIPSLRFQELVEEEEDTTPVKSFKVLKRSPNRPVSACEARGTPLDNTQVSLLRSSSSVPTKSSLQLPSNTSENSHNRRTRSLEQREAAYAIARAQIFDTGVEVEDKAEEHSQEYSKPQNSPILSQSLNQGQTKTKNDIVRRTSTGSSVSSSSSSSGTTLADVNTGGVWMTAAGNNGNIDCISSNDAQNDYAIRNVITSCECSVSHGLNIDTTLGSQQCNALRRSCMCYHQPPQELYHRTSGCSCQNNHGTQSQGLMRHPLSIHGLYCSFSNRKPHQHQQQQQQRLYNPNQQHHHQHHSGYQHPTQHSCAHVISCIRHDPQQYHQYRHPYYNQHYQTSHNQYQYHHCNHSQHHSYTRNNGSSNTSNFQDPRWLECTGRPESSHTQLASPSASVTVESTPMTLQDTSPPPPPLSGPFQVTVRPFPSSNGYRPYRQGISLPQQMARQTQQRQHPHPHSQSHIKNQTPIYGQQQAQGQGQRQNRQQGHSTNVRQQQPQVGRQQTLTQHQQQSQHKSNLGFMNPFQEMSIQSPSPTPSAASSSATSSLRRHPQQSNSTLETAKNRENSVYAPMIIYDVDRRPPKSTELYDPYASPSPACGSGSKSRHPRH